MKPLSFRLKAVLFDFDGTLTRPGALDFPRIKKAIGCPLNRPVLEFIDSLPSPQEREKAHRKLEDFEAEAAANSLPNEGAEGLVEALKAAGLKIGLITRNSLRSVRRGLENFRALALSDFNVVVTREASAAPKPSPEAVLLAARELKVKTGEILMVGDYLFDVQAGNRAGAWTVLLKNGDPTGPDDSGSDFVISDLSGLSAIVRLGLPLPQGKLPNDLLQAFLGMLPREDPSVLLFPAVGEDVAAVDGSGAEVLVLKSDPVTFVSRSIGRYAVAVNANDIATSGATPRWLLATMLFPRGTVPWEIRELMKELAQSARECGIVLVGGHTEVTDAVVRPVVTGMIVGTVARDRLIDKKNMKPGDALLLTKALAVEGSAIIAREFRRRLAASGMPRDEMDRCRDLLSRISIVEEACVASNFVGVHAMHDVTEGGLATAAAELSSAGGHRLRIEMDRIPVYPETVKLCRMLKLNPLGLIGSGSLLIVCSPGDLENLIRSIQTAGVPVTCIGGVLEEGEGIQAVSGGRRVPWPCFERDELTRLFNP